MVVVVVRDANGFEVGVVVVVDSSSELISKGMVGGGGEALMQTIALCVDKYGKVCVNILRSLLTQQSLNQYHYVFSLLTQNPKTKYFFKSIPPFALCVLRKCLDHNGLRA